MEWKDIFNKPEDVFQLKILAIAEVKTEMDSVSTEGGEFALN